MSYKDHTQIVHEKLLDTQMRTNIFTVMHTLRKNRKNLLKTRYHNWEELREIGKRAKNNNLAHLDERLLEFEKNATKNGFKVHWADTKEEACKIIYDLMKEKNVNKILKGKSMASEEIHLNHYLEEKGVQAFETDLGEVIIQLLGEAPVHIVVPAIHKNRYEIGEIFAEKLGAKKESEPEKLNAIARNHMREEFKTFTMGLSGVNFALAKEGAIWLLENEGNGRMCTTLPDIHVAICGIEKLVENFEDACALDTLLIPSATGQVLTNYNNIISGPRREGELDGPKEVHIVMLNNNRTDMATNEEAYEALRCIRCGACINHCPVYDNIGGHSYMSTYPGPIGAAISSYLSGIDEIGSIVSLCSLCGRCDEVCPVKIPLSKIIRQTRRDKVGQGKNPPKGADKLHHNKMEQQVFKGFEYATTHGLAWRTTMKGAKLGNGFIHSFGKSLPVVKNWLRYKDLLEFDYDLHKNLEQRAKEDKGLIYE